MCSDVNDCQSELEFTPTRKPTDNKASSHSYLASIYWVAKQNVTVSMESASNLASHQILLAHLSRGAGAQGHRGIDEMLNGSIQKPHSQ